MSKELLELSRLTSYSLSNFRRLYILLIREISPILRNDWFEMLGRVVGIEPTNNGATNRRLNHLAIHAVISRIIYTI